MNFKHFFYIVVFTCCYTAIQADLFDLYNIAVFRNLPAEIQHYMTKQYLQKFPLLLTALDYVSLEQPNDKFSVHHNVPWGAVLLNEMVGTLEMDYWSFDHNSSFVWSKNNTWQGQAEGFSIAPGITNVKFCTSKHLKWLKYIVPSLKYAASVLRHNGLNTNSVCSNQYYNQEAHIVISNLAVQEDEMQKLKLAYEHNVLVITKITKRHFYLRYESDKSLWSIYEFKNDAVSNTSSSIRLTNKQVQKTQLIAVATPSEPNIVSIYKHVGQNYWKKVVELKHPAPIYSASFDQTKNRIVTACSDGQARIWELPTQNISLALLNFPATPIFTLEQLLFLKLINTIYKEHGRADLNALSSCDSLSKNLASNSQAAILAYLLTILKSFGPNLSQAIIDKYQITFVSAYSSCSIQ